MQKRFDRTPNRKKGQRGFWQGGGKCKAVEPTLFRTSTVITQLGLLSLDETIHNPTSLKVPFTVYNPTDQPITCPNQYDLKSSVRSSHIKGG
jgi:hypothetical protein